MKFFFKKINKTNILKIINQKRGSITNNNTFNLNGLHVLHKNEEISDFVRFFSKSGLLIKDKNLFCGVIKNLNYFFYQNCNFLYDSYPSVK